MDFHFDYTKLEKAKKLRNGKAYFTLVMDSNKKDSTPFLAYNRSLGEGKEEARSIISAYRNPGHSNHSKAYDAYAEANFNEETLTDNLTARAMTKNGARKLECRNSAAENEILNSFQPRSNDDKAAWDQFRNVAAQTWNACGYDQFPANEIADFVFSMYPIEEKDRAIDRVTAVYNKCFPHPARLKKTTAAAIKSNLELVPEDEREPLDKAKKVYNTLHR